MILVILRDGKDFSRLKKSFPPCNKKCHIKHVDMTFNADASGRLLITFALVNHRQLTFLVSPFWRTKIFRLRKATTQFFRL